MRIARNLAESAPENALAARVEGLDWGAITAALDSTGFAIVSGLLCADECAELAGRYSSQKFFRSRVIMARHGFGRGEYQYFADPLPSVVATLRTHVYARLAPVASRWNASLGKPSEFPATLREFRQLCFNAGQTRPTPLLLKYGPGDFNCLHQDLYGTNVFPIQLAILLSEPTAEFVGGEFVLTEQRPRMQSRVEVVPLRRGDAVLFAVNFRPVQGVRGIYAARVRHGVSRVQSGYRYTLGVIFHDAE